MPKLQNTLRVGLPLKSSETGRKRYGEDLDPSTTCRDNGIDCHVIFVLCYGNTLKTHATAFERVLNAGKDFKFNLRLLVKARESLVSQRYFSFSTNLRKLRRFCFQQTEIPPKCLVLSKESQRQFGHRERDSSADVSSVFKRWKRFLGFLAKGAFFLSTILE